MDLFCEDEKAKENQLSLYNALHDTDYTLDEIEISDIRIENTIYMNFRNDMAFNYDNRLLILSEHQSTINNNMPLRSLMHIGRTYEKLVPVRERYKKKMVRIPKPEFYVLYNGKEDIENETELRLSDAYRDSKEDEKITGRVKEKAGTVGAKKLAKTFENGIDKEEEYSLQLVVKVLDINLDSKADILKKCPILNEYAQFVECVRRHKEMDEENAMKCAIEECIENNILREYLLRRGSEVVNMLCAEYDYDMDIAVQREESYEDGLTEGKIEGRAESVVELLKSAGKVSEELESTILSQTDVSVLNKWLKIAATVSSVEEFKLEIEE